MLLIIQVVQKIRKEYVQQICQSEYVQQNPQNIIQQLRKCVMVSM